jgi:hypothetical protein
MHASAVHEPNLAQIHHAGTLMVACQPVQRPRQAQLARQVHFPGDNDHTDVPIRHHINAEAGFERFPPPMISMACPLASKSQRSFASDRPADAQ